MTRLRPVLLAALLLGAFYCFWNAGSAERNDPLFTEEQMRLLAWTCLALAGLVAWWRPHTP